MYRRQGCERILRGSYEEFRDLFFPDGAPPAIFPASGGPEPGEPEGEAEPSPQEGEVKQGLSPNHEP